MFIPFGQLYFQEVLKFSDGNSLMVQWLGFRPSTAGGTGLIPGGGTKIPHAKWHGQKKEKGKRKEIDQIWDKNKGEKRQAKDS